MGLAESLERENLKDKDLLQEVEQGLRAAILRAPAHWSHHLKLGQFYLKYYQTDPRAKLPLAIKELGAAVALFPESGFLHLQLGLGLGWMEPIPDNVGYGDVGVTISLKSGTGDALGSPNYATVMIKDSL